jgi:hypothetical protein
MALRQCAIIAAAFAALSGSASLAYSASGPVEGLTAMHAEALPLAMHVPATLDAYYLAPATLAPAKLAGVAASSAREPVQARPGTLLRVAYTEPVRPIPAVVADEPSAAAELAARAIPTPGSAALIAIAGFIIVGRRGSR